MSTTFLFWSLIYWKLIKEDGRDSMNKDILPIIYLFVYSPQIKKE
jgi:hypothetical protein